ncbi:hypothetical protein DPMN_124755 [Dreissena polymorpha]|uniref:Uncharacterized protein n=2 Tax=Dreissena polymorpha TaxID=45954 RepID=A0A9D4GSP4_DREPO|nr:hypothetical protein DPMN_124755 [Dreissena polymorpha]
MASLDTKESHEYVESTMGPSITQVAEFTPVKQNRKRNHSSPVHGSAKKVKEDVACESSSSDKMSSLSEPVSNELHPVNSDLKALLSKLSTDICAMNVSINNRIDQLESSIEQKLTHKFAQLLDKRVNIELGRIKTNVQEQLDSFKEKITEELQEVSEKCSSVTAAAGGPSGGQDISKNLVIRGLPYHEGENLNSKVISMFKDVMKCNVQVCNTQRKTSANSSKPGVVIATMQSQEDRQKVLKNKSKLNESRTYSDVYIQCDQSREERLMMSNFRTLVGAMNAEGVSVRGNRVVRNRPMSSDDRQDQGISHSQGDGSQRNTGWNGPRGAPRRGGSSGRGTNSDRGWQRAQQNRGRRGGDNY